MFEHQQHQQSNQMIQQQGQPKALKPVHLNSNQVNVSGNPQPYPQATTNYQDQQIKPQQYPIIQQQYPQGQHQQNHLEQSQLVRSNQSTPQVNPQYNVSQIPTQNQPQYLDNTKKGTVNPQQSQTQSIRQLPGNIQHQQTITKEGVYKNEAQRLNNDMYEGEPYSNSRANPGQNLQPEFRQHIDQNQQSRVPPQQGLVHPHNGHSQNLVSDDHSVNQYPYKHYSPITTPISQSQSQMMKHQGGVQGLNPQHLQNDGQHDDKLIGNFVKNDEVRFYYVPWESFKDFNVIQQEMVYKSLAHKLQFLKSQNETLQHELDEQGRARHAQFYEREVHGIQDMQLQERQKNKVLMERFMEVIAQQKAQLEDQQKKLDDLERRGTQLPIHQVNHERYQVNPSLAEYRERKYAQMKKAQQDPDLSEQAPGQDEQEVLQLQDHVRLQVKEALLVVDNSRTQSDSINKELQLNKKMMIELINELSELKKVQASTITQEDKKRIVQNLNLIEQDYNAGINHKEQLNGQLIEIQKKTHNIEEMIRISTEFLNIFDEFKRIHDCVKAQKYKMPDYRILFEKLIQENNQAFEEYKQLNMQQ